MSKKITQEEVIQDYKHLGYELISEYKRNDQELFVKDEEGYICRSSSYSNFKKGNKPKKFHVKNKYTINNIKLWLKLNNKNYTLISNEYEGDHKQLFFKDDIGYILTSTLRDLQQGQNPSIFHMNNPYTIQNIRLWISINKKRYKLLSTEYINSCKSKLLFKCPKGHKFKMTWSNFQQGQNCPKCSHQQPSEETVIYTVAPWMIDLGVSKEDAKKYLPQSNQKITVTCPYCGKYKEIKISYIYNKKSISCPCGDGVSYPEKIIISLLNQLNVTHVREYMFKECKNKKYDFYLSDYNCIIECHGGQHYHGGFDSCGGRTLIEEQKNDIYKKELALNNGIKNYIVLDCRESNLKFIKTSILNSELNNMFNLSNIDWILCDKFALGNIVNEICNYWNLHNDINNENLSTTDIGKIFNLSKTTICRYLKYGTNLGWCNYNPQKSMKSCIKNRKSTSKSVEILKDEISLGVFESAHELDRQSEKLFGVKLNFSQICSVCRGDKQKYKGFSFKYIINKEDI